MQYKDTLELYDELIAGGASESAARIQAKQLGDVGNALKQLGNDMFWMRIIGGAMTVTFFSNGFFMWLAK